jgi:hypothetical protein
MLMSAASAWIICRRFLPAATHSVIALVGIGAGVVIVPALEGAAVSWILWHFLDKGTLRFGKLVLSCGVAWAMVPPIVLLLHLRSPWAPLMMIVVSVASAASLHQLVPVVDLALSEPHKQESTPFGLLPVSYSGIWLAMAIAAGLEGAAIPFLAGWLFAAGLLLAAAIFALLWQRASASSKEAQARQNDRAPAKLVFTLLLAVLVSTIALIPRLSGGWPGSGDRGLSGKSARGREGSAAKGQVRNASADPGYKGIILWMVPKKKEIVAPAPLSLLPAPGSSRRSVVIPFDGPYWYFQVPHSSPGRNAHIVHGDPTGVNIRSTSLLPLVMEAHQSLGSSIDLASCRELEVDIRNGDNIPGNILLGVILTDSHTPGKPSMHLGERAVTSSQPGHFTVKSSPVSEELRYTIPSRRPIDRFDEITVDYTPAPDRAIIGAKIAIQQFVLLPR